MRVFKYKGRALERLLANSQSVIEIISDKSLASLARFSSLYKIAVIIVLIHLWIDVSFKCSCALVSPRDKIIS